MKREPLPVARALVSVWDKTGLEPFCRALADLGIEIVSSGGTARTLEEAGIPVVPVSEVTGFPEILDGRVKTLNPMIHGGILARKEIPDHLKQLQSHNITPFDLVVVNLYPFQKTVEKGGILSEVRRREHFEKPREKTKKKLFAAKKRVVKRTRRN